MSVNPPNAKQLVWQPIETAPKLGISILAYDGWNVLVVWWEDLGFGKGEWFYGDDNYTWPTHWMPLPAPPLTEWN